MSGSAPAPPGVQWFSILAAVLDPRSAPRLAKLLVGAVLARGRRTVTSWIRAAGLSDEYRPCYTTVSAAGARSDRFAARLVRVVVAPLLAGCPRLVFALDDTPTPRYGTHVQGAGIHHNPTPGPAGGPFVYGHVWVVLAVLVPHPLWGVIALPLLARLRCHPMTLPPVCPMYSRCVPRDSGRPHSLLGNVASVETVPSRPTLRTRGTQSACLSPFAFGYSST